MTSCVAEFWPDVEASRMAQESLAHSDVLTTRTTTVYTEPMGSLKDVTICNIIYLLIRGPRSYLQYMLLPTPLTQTSSLQESDVVCMIPVRLERNEQIKLLKI